MDYSDDACMSEFTEGQKQRMWDCLTGFRSTLVYQASDYISCIEDHCANGIKDADEVDIDCGGVDCQPCYNGAGYNLCYPRLGSSKLYVRDGQSELQKIAIICHTDPSLHHYCRYADVGIPDAYPDRKQSELCDEACDEDDLFTANKCDHQDVFFAIQKIEFNYTPVGPEHSYYQEAIADCDVFDTWIYSSTLHPVFPNTTVPNNVNSLISAGGLNVTLEENVLYKVKLGGNFKKLGGGTYWSTSSAFFYSIGEIFEITSNYNLSQGFGKDIFISESLNTNISQTFSANKGITFQAGTEVTVDPGNFKEFRLSKFGCINSPYPSGSNGGSLIAFKPLPSLSSQNVKVESPVDIFPNPVTNGSFSIFHDGWTVKSVQLSSTNGGSIKQNLRIHQGSDQNKLQCEIPNDFNKGVYIVIIKMDERETFYKKIIVQ